MIRAHPQSTGGVSTWTGTSTSGRQVWEQLRLLPPFHAPAQLSSWVGAQSGAKGSGQGWLCCSPGVPGSAFANLIHPTGRAPHLPNMPGGLNRGERGLATFSFWLFPPGWHRKAIRNSEMCQDLWPHPPWGSLRHTIMPQKLPLPVNTHKLQPTVSQIPNS